MVVRILLVEDDDHKIADLEPIVSSVLPSAYLTIKRSVREGTVAVKGGHFDLVILDLSLPTFDQKAFASGGTAQPQGGFEVLRMLDHIDRRPEILIVSQYYQVEFDGSYVPLDQSVEIIASRFGAKIMGVSIYDMESDEWASKFRGQIKECLCVS